MYPIPGIPVDEVISIHLYWRCSEHGRKLPTRLQSCWFMLRTADGVCQDYPLPDSVLLDSECMADVVVTLAEQHGHFIDQDLVRNNWPHRSAVWMNGA